ncbi:MAG: PP2C family protein-serine/threonine phosphatase [Anaerolineales bacterium]|jgi:serine phosphatase RsbU (regulator of sigma subunit)
MEVQIAISKIRKYATSSSGDTAEVIERPNGGVSVVLADGQSSGKGAKWVSSLVVRKVIQFIADGVRDGAAARAASDALFTERDGRVSATLNIVSADLQTGTVVISRNNPAPVLLSYDQKVKFLSTETAPVGLRRDTRPMITEVPLEVGLTVIAYTDGLVHAGSYYGESMDIGTCLKVELEDETPSPQKIADSLISHALKLERGRPRDDISIIVLRVVSGSDDLIRRMTVKLPLNSLGK